MRCLFFGLRVVPGDILDQFSVYVGVVVSSGSVEDAAVSLSDDGGDRIGLTLSMGTQYWVSATRRVEICTVTNRIIGAHLVLESLRRGFLTDVGGK
jgi:hypothetical protein